MPMLQNNRWEAFANNLVRGMTQYKAYKEAGFKPNSRTASELAQNPKIVARVEELKLAAVQETSLSSQRILDEIEKLGFSNILDFTKVADNGENLVLDFSRMTREQAAAIASIETEETTNPRTGEVTRRTKFKLYDKRTALVDLGRWLQMWVDRKEVKHAGVMFHVTPDDMRL